VEQALFRGSIVAPGRFVALDTMGLRTFLQDHIGTTLDLVFREPKSRRSADQNAYLHAVPLRIIAEHLGYTIPECKYALMGHCWGWEFNALAGREVPVKPHTSEMSRKDCDYFIDWVIPWAAEQFGLAIPLPNEGD
jgi:hypothetical protein